jgi:predicted fused transcriptional regulator/phosphomethylpyrimidine kinase
MSNRVTLLKIPQEFIDTYCTTEKGQVVCYLSKPYYICPVQIGENFYTSQNILTIHRLDPAIRSMLDSFELVSVEIPEPNDDE